MTRIRVEMTGTSAQPYDVVVQAGCLREVASHAREVAPAHRYALIADETVAALWAEPTLDSFASSGLAASLITFPPGEANKTRATWAQLTDQMLELGFGRDTTVVALGGGVVGDLAGFVAATFMRGLPVIQVPTTLLAMVDASIGGKTGVDAPSGKNLVGAFHQPGIVVVDPAVLSTLPADQLRGGLAEALKHGAIADRAYFDWIAESADPLIAADVSLLTSLIDGSVRIKAGFVSADPTEAGPRAALNFGHTIGHAVEHAFDYGIHHGQCVALGMLVEARIGELIGVTQPGTQYRLQEGIDSVGLTVRMPSNLTAGDILDLMRRDKKARQGAVRFSLISEIGTPARGDSGGWTFPVDDRVIAEAWTTIL